MKDFVLNPYQRQFVDSSEQYVGYFGGVGNGKTSIACIKILELLSKYPNNLCLIGRLTYPELRDSTKEVFLQTLKSFYPPEAYQHNKAENSITLWNKSSVIFRHLDNKEALLGPNLGAFYIDQAEEVDEEAFLTLQSRLRRPGVKHKGLITGNPAGHNWVYYKFGMEKANDAKNFSKDQFHRMITAPTLANIENLPINYIEQLRQSYSPEWFARFVDGSWDAFEGQIFDLTQITGYDKLPVIRMVLTGCDPAISKEKEACNTAFCTVGIAENGHVYDLETIAGKWGFYETLEEFDKILKRQRPIHLGVENVAYQRALFEACQKHFPQVIVHDLKADKDKYRRAKSISHIVNQGLFHTNNQELMNELSAFRWDQKGKEKKDRVDALVHVLHMVQMFAPTRFDPIAEHPFKGMTAAQAFFNQVEAQAKREMIGDLLEQRFTKDLHDGHVDPDFY